ncbi:MAG: carbon-nitrogen hydrolase family protein [bacterium]|nr:carbon-nitrogen hydrolase family protein [bacterium]
MSSCCYPLSAIGEEWNWNFESPREEVRPHSARLENADEQGDILEISADERSGLMGQWVTQRPVKPGHYYRFRVLRQGHGLSNVRRAAPVRLLWQDASGESVLRDEEARGTYRPSGRPTAYPEFPADGETNQDGWTEISEVYRAPSDARQLRIELCFRWGDPHSRLRWSGIELQEVPKPTQRIVRLAAIHLQPQQGTTPREKCEQFAPLIAEAAQRQADLVVLPETLTYYASGRSYAEVAEPVPGPSTDYFAQLAQKHQLHLVVGLLERDEHLVYNVAVLLGPNGEIVGKYRKTCLPRGEIEGGITPGESYPVYETAIAKIGMMVCYDGFFPEVARELTKNGAEIIAFPVWGCNPVLSAARAAENHVFVVSSTYTDASADWMVTAIYDRDGSILDQAREWGSLAMAEVNLDEPMYWHSLGNFRAQIERHRPVVSSSESTKSSSSSNAGP